MTTLSVTDGSGRDGWLAKVPIHWATATLGRYVAAICDGPFGSSLKSSHYSEEGARVIRLQNIGSGEFLDEGRVYIDSGYFQSLRRHEAKPHDLVVAGLGDANNPLGRACLVPAYLGNAIVKADCFRVRLDERHLLHRFAMYFLNSVAARSEISNVSKGATRERMNLSAVCSIRIPVPPIANQSEIVAFLDRETAEADALVSKYERLIELLEEKRVALITRAVTKGLDPIVLMKDSEVEWIGTIPQHWSVEPIGRAVTTMCDGPFGSSLKSNHYTESGIQVIRLQNIGKGLFHNENRAFIETAYFESLNGHDAKPGDLLVAGLGDTNSYLGRSCLVPKGLGPAMVKADCFRIRLNAERLLHEFAMHYLNSKAARAEVALASKGATRERMNLGSVARLRLPVPPITEQQSIVAAINNGLTQIELVCNKVRHAIDLVLERHSALITASVIGQIDINTYHSDRRPIEVSA